MRLITVSQLLLESIRSRVIDVQVNKINLIYVLNLKPMHDGRQCPACWSPECEELDQLRPSGGQLDRRRVRRNQSLFRGGSYIHNRRILSRRFFQCLCRGRGLRGLLLHRCGFRGR